MPLAPHGIGVGLDSSINLGQSLSAHRPTEEFGDLGGFALEQQADAEDSAADPDAGQRRDHGDQRGNERLPQRHLRRDGHADHHDDRAGEWTDG